MPELPDVDIFKSYFDSTSLHQNIKEIETEKSRIFKTNTDKLKEIMEGHSFDHTHRTGKYLFTKIKSDGYLLLHFGMTGYLKYFRNEEEKPDYIQMLITFTNGFHLAYISKRKFGRVEIVKDIDQYRQENNIGPDAMKLEKEQFIQLIDRKKGKIKTSLMDQGLISGLGNVYVDEILFHARLHPETAINDLNEVLIGEIHDTMHKVVETAIRVKADPENFPDSYLLPHRQEGADCPNCGGKIKKIKVNNRGTYICPECQKI